MYIYIYILAGGSGSWMVGVGWWWVVVAVWGLVVEWWVVVGGGGWWWMEVGGSGEPKPQTVSSLVTHSLEITVISSVCKKIPPRKRFDTNILQSGLGDKQQRRNV